MESTDSSLKELEKGFGNIRKTSKEQTGSCIAGKWRSDEEEQETAVDVLTFSIKLAEKSKFSSVLEEPEAKSQRAGSVHYVIYIVSKRLIENNFFFFLKKKEGRGEKVKKKEKQKEERKTTSLKIDICYSMILL